MLHIHSFTFNPFQENTWLIWSDKGNCLIIDPGCYSMEEKKIFESFIREKSLNPVRLINTHCHIDHVLGNPFVNRTWGLTPEIHPADQPMLDALPQYSMNWGINVEPQPETIHSMLEGTEIHLDGYVFTVLFTPGHAPGEICLYCAQENILIAGDVLFNGSIGRTDLPGGDFNQLQESIRQKLYILPETTRVCPGHGTDTTIGHEKQFNPYVRP